MGDGTPVPQNSQVSTGAASSALVLWSDGTYLQLDENSDPLYYWEPPDLYIAVGIGWFLIDTGAIDVTVVNDLAQITVGSRVVVHVIPGQSFTAYLLEGSAQLVRPSGRPLLAGEKVIVVTGGTARYEPITPNERAALERRFSRWNISVPTPTRDRFDFERLFDDEGDPDPGDPDGDGPDRLDPDPGDPDGDGPDRLDPDEGVVDPGGVDQETLDPDGNGTEPQIIR